MVAIFFYCFATFVWRCVILVIAHGPFFMHCFFGVNFCVIAQFGKHTRDFLACKRGDIGALESGHESLLSGWSKSKDGGFGLSQYSKPYVLFSVIDAASAAIDYSRRNLDDGVVDSPPS